MAEGEAHASLAGPYVYSSACQNKVPQIERLKQPMLPEPEHLDSSALWPGLPRSLICRNGPMAKTVWKTLRPKQHKQVSQQEEASLLGANSPFSLPAFLQPKGRAVLSQETGKIWSFETLRDQK